VFPDGNIPDSRETLEAHRTADAAESRKAIAWACSVRQLERLPEGISNVP
jgi:hypothetical protein